MHTGTLIRDLMATVERAELRAQQLRIAEEIELRRMYELQTPSWQDEATFSGAA